MAICEDANEAFFSHWAHHLVWDLKPLPTQPSPAKGQDLHDVGLPHERF